MKCFIFNCVALLAIFAILCTDLSEEKQPKKREKGPRRKVHGKRKRPRYYPQFHVQLLQQKYGLDSTNGVQYYQGSGIFLPGRDSSGSHDEARRLLDWHAQNSMDEEIAKQIYGLTGNYVTSSNTQKPKPMEHPESEQLVRLRGSGSYMNAGLLEVYRAGQWGVVCDDGWDVKDASVACRQLGFPQGATSVAKDNETLPFSVWGARPILMDELQCSGSEARLQECRYSTEHDCTLTQAAALTCVIDAGCPEGWFSGFGKCYKLFSKAKGVRMAGMTCSESNATLVSIDSVEENHFLSDVLKKSTTDAHIWYTGGKKSKNVWKWFKRVSRKPSKKRSKNRKSKSKSAFRNRKSAVNTDKWFPGWPSSTPSYVEPIAERKYDCLVLSDEYKHPERGITLVDYFFWKATTCRRRGGINFICQVEMKRPKLGSGKDCYEDNGVNYRGMAQVTKTGTPCLLWTLSRIANERSHPGKGLGNHNFCRNPDDDKSPWCWVDHERRKFGYCEIANCSRLTTTTAGPQTTQASSDLNCPDNEFFCEKDKSQCLPVAYRCDNELDCTHGEDEEGCEYLLDLFTKTEDSELRSVIPGKLYTSASYILMSNEGCATKCLQTTDFICRSFIYDSMKRSCQLSSDNTANGVLTASYQFDYYQLESQVNCSGKFVCADSFCVNSSRRCDGENDCKDFTDEINCDNDEQETEDVVEVSLEGDEEHAGTVLVTYKGSTGVICDDKWDLKDARVVCRMLGYRGAAGATVMNSFGYPPETGKFMLDNVQCEGDENSLSECPKKNWREHDCTAYEIAGVVCLVSKVCEMDQFKCPDELCVSTQVVCDGNEDCADGSDEKDCRYLQFFLVNGTSESEGRVELIKNGLRGTVCDDQWDDSDADVVCKMMGYRYGGEAVTSASFGPGDGPIWLDNMECVGTEQTLVQCRHAGWAKHDCDHDEDAGVRCYLTAPSTTRTTTTTTTKTPTTTASTTTVHTTLEEENSSTIPSTDVTITVSLSAGSGSHEGNVILTIRSKKYTICDDYWENSDAAVICKMLGYLGGGIATEKSFFGLDSTPIFLDDVACLGTESDIGDCKATVGLREHDCSQSELAGVICSGKDAAEIPAPAQPQTSPSVQTAGTCGQRPYDYTDLLGLRRRRSPVSSISSDDMDEDLTAPRTLGDKPRIQKVVGGRFAEHGAYPWQVRIHKVYSIRADGTVHGSHHCGGVIISEYWILSAAHCFHGKRKSEFIIIVGDHHQRQKDKGEQSFKVVEIIPHSYYSDKTKDYDFALIRIIPNNGTAIQFNPFVQPACLPDENTPHREGTKCLISGWGNTKSSTRYPDTLKATEIPLISQGKCQYLYDRAAQGVYTDRMLCAGYVAGGVDTCDGDSGGPLICNVGGVYTVLGVTSWGRGCAEPNSPGVYARVATVISWIKSTILFTSPSQKQGTLPKRP